jgi:hypothetical protein
MNSPNYSLIAGEYVLPQRGAFADAALQTGEAASADGIAWNAGPIWQEGTLSSDGIVWAD